MEPCFGGGRAGGLAGCSGPEWAVSRGGGAQLCSGALTWTPPKSKLAGLHRRDSSPGIDDRALSSVGMGGAKPGEDGLPVSHRLRRPLPRWSCTCPCYLPIFGL